MLAAGTTQSRKKSKKQKKKQRQQQAQRAASGFDVHSESETDTETAPAHQDNADVSTNGATDISQTDQDSEDHVLEWMMRATSINQAAANSEVISRP